jgi:hypothetical protein
VNKNHQDCGKNPVRTRLIPVRKGLNPEREGGVQHVGSKALQGVAATEWRCQRKLCMVKAILLESQSRWAMVRRRRKADETPVQTV